MRPHHVAVTPIKYEIPDSWLPHAQFWKLLMLARNLCGISASDQSNWYGFMITHKECASRYFKLYSIIYKIKWFSNIEWISPAVFYIATLSTLRRKNYAVWNCPISFILIVLYCLISKWCVSYKADMDIHIEFQNFITSWYYLRPGTMTSNPYWYN